MYCFARRRKFQAVAQHIADRSAEHTGIGIGITGNIEVANNLNLFFPGLQPKQIHFGNNQFRKVHIGQVAHLLFLPGSSPVEQFAQFVLNRPGAFNHLVERRITFIGRPDRRTHPHLLQCTVDSENRIFKVMRHHLHNAVLGRKRVVQLFCPFFHLLFQYNSVAVHAVQPPA